MKPCRSVKMVLLSVLVLSALVLSSCQPATPAPPPAPKTGGELVVITKTEPDTLDPHQTQSRYASIVMNAMFESLVYMDKDLKVQPGLATSWEVSPDKLSWTFKLRQGIKFHDGTPFNAEAAKFNFDRIVDPGIKSVGAGVIIGPYKSSEVIDEYTVKVNFSEPYGAFLNAMAEAYGWFAMVSPEAAKKYGKDFNLNPVGTGPFKFEKYVPQQMVSMVRNPDYNWGAEFHPYRGAAYLDKITFRFVSEDSTRVAALETGEADVIMEIPPRDVQRIRDDKRFEVISAGVPGVPVVAIMNMKKPPLDDLKVRQAINFAVDQERVVKQLYAGEWFAAHNVLAPQTWAYDEQAAKTYTYDPEKAKKLLDEAGWKPGPDGIRVKEGKRLELLYLALFAPPYDPGEALQAQLREVGIDLKVQVLEGAQHRAACRRGDHDLAWTRWVSLDPMVLDTYFNSKNIGTGFNYTHVPDPEMDALLAESRAETDQNKRREIFVKMQRKIMNEAMVVPVHLTVMIVGMKAEVEGFELGPGGFIPWRYNQWGKR